jgi:hypothetical protein
MTKSNLSQPDAVADALRSRILAGHGLSVPYARKWEIAGCEPLHSLWRRPYDGLAVLGVGLVELGVPIDVVENGILVGNRSAPMWVAANRSMHGDGPPDAYLVGWGDDRSVLYTGNAPEVVIELLRMMPAPTPPLPTSDIVQVGFPGIENTTVTYVGSWQWNVHGETRDPEFVPRAANATLAAIRAKEGAQRNEPGR